MARGDTDELRCTAKTTGGKPCGNPVLPGSTRCGRHKFKIPGRPSKMTPALQEEIIDALIDGAYLETAAAAAGINERTLFRWMKRGADATVAALESCESDRVVDPDMSDIYERADIEDWPYIDFCRATKAASAFAEIELLRRIVRGKGQAWQRFMTVLERRHQQRWRLRADDDQQGDRGAGAPKPHTASDNEKRSQIMGLLRGAVDLDAIYPDKAAAAKGEAAKLDARPKRKQAQARKRAAAKPKPKPKPK